MATPAEHWIDAWFRAWTEHKPDMLQGVYAPGPVQRSAPFRDYTEPREYAAWAFADEHEVEVWFAEPLVETADGAACEWWAVSTDGAGTTGTLAGVSLLSFGSDGRVTDQRDHWSLETGEHRPPEGWGPVRRHGSLDTRR
jgi:SnoaL-like domain